jgi:hypothetical protein
VYVNRVLSILTHTLSHTLTLFLFYWIALEKLPTGLVEFDASHTLIDGGLTASNFEGLNDLTWLLLDGCAFQTSIPTEFALLPGLEYFYISDSQITGDLSYMQNMPVLFEHFASNNPELVRTLACFISIVERSRDSHVFDFSHPKHYPKHYYRAEISQALSASWRV